MGVSQRFLAGLMQAGKAVEEKGEPQASSFESSAVSESASFMLSNIEKWLKAIRQGGVRE